MVNKTIGGYEVLEQLGAGAMSRVYLAKPLKLPEKRVAFKVLDPALALDAQSVNRFEREAHAASMPHHGNVVDVLDLGYEDGVHYIVMELVRGIDLRQALDAALQNPAYPCLPVGLVIYILEEIALGLRSAHDGGIIHRDVKPTNVLLGFEGELKVVDFGLARPFGDTADMAATFDATVTGTFLGTASYASPEQAARSDSLDARTDVFSLGVLAYELLTGKKPFTGSDFEGLLHNIRHTPHPPLAASACRPVFPELAACLDGMLVKDREQRTAGMSDVLTGLQASRQALEQQGLRYNNRRLHLSHLAQDPGAYSAQIQAEALATLPAVEEPAQDFSWETAVVPPRPAPESAPESAPKPATTAPPASPPEPRTVREPEPVPPPTAPRPEHRPARSRRLWSRLGLVGVVVVLALAGLKVVPGMLGNQPVVDTQGATGWLQVSGSPAGTQLAFRRGPGGSGDSDFSATRFKTLGSKPALLHLAPGAWIGVANLADHQSQTKQWSISTAETTTVRFDLRSVPQGASSLLVHTTPAGAEVFLDGAPLTGATPAVFHDLAPGQHDLTVVTTMDGQRREETRRITLRPGEEKVLTLTFSAQ